MAGQIEREHAVLLDERRHLAGPRASRRTSSRARASASAAPCRPSVQWSGMPSTDAAPRAPRHRRCASARARTRTSTDECAMRRERSTAMAGPVLRLASVLERVLHTLNRLSPSVGRPRRARDRRVERHRPRDRAGVARAGADVALTYRSNRAGAEAVAREIEALGRKACGASARSRRRAGHRAARSRGARRRSAGSTSGSTTPAPTSSPARAPRSRRVAEARPAARRSICAARCSRRGRRRELLRRAGSGRRHHQHELGSRAHRHGRRRTRSVAAVKGGVLAFSKSLARDRSRRGSA